MISLLLYFERRKIQEFVEQIRNSRTKVRSTTQKESIQFVEQFRWGANKKLVIRK